MYPVGTLNVTDMDYIYILDYETGRCIITTIPSEYKDVEEWLYSQGYSQSSIHYMVSGSLSLDIQV